MNEYMNEQTNEWMNEAWVKETTFKNLRLKLQK